MPPTCNEDPSVSYRDIIGANGRLTTSRSAIVVWMGALSFAFCNPCAATIRYVSKTGNDANDGLSWATAKASIGAGMASAGFLDQVWVAAGTYVETVTLKSNVGFYGGFAGTETQLSQRPPFLRPNPDPFATIIDGNNAVVVVIGPAQGGALDRRVDGFTIRNGQTGLNALDRSLNNTVTQNGTGLKNCYGVQNNLIFRNTLGIATDCTEISNNVIIGNDTAINCGASRIINNTFVGNQTAIYGSNASPIVANNIISFNGTALAYDVPLDSNFNPGLRSNNVFGNVTNENAAGATSIYTDPKLVATPYGEVHLLPGSPCIDAGRDADVIAGIPDMDGQARIQFAHVDIGAEEFNGTAPPAYEPPVLRVSPLGDDANDGSNWPAAKRTVQAAINATGRGPADVWVAEGTYLERIIFGDFIHVYGGFSGVETARSQRNWVTHTSILDGSAAGSVVSVTGVGYNVSTIDGFTIRNGNAAAGGGINSNVSPIIANNIITNNAATGSSGGGGIYGKSPTITSNVIISNTAAASGGGVYCTQAILQNNVIARNQAQFGGGVYFSPPGPVYLLGGSMASNQVQGNKATSSGGGVYFNGGRWPRLTNSTFVGNSAPTAGAIYADGTGLRIKACTIVGNTSSGSSGCVWLLGAWTYHMLLYDPPGIADSIVAFNSTGLSPFNTTECYTIASMATRHSTIPVPI